MLLAVRAALQYALWEGAEGRGCCPAQTRCHLSIIISEVHQTSDFAPPGGPAGVRYGMHGGDLDVEISIGNNAKHYINKIKPTASVNSKV